MKRDQYFNVRGLDLTLIQAVYDIPSRISFIFKNSGLCFLGRAHEARQNIILSLEP